MQPDQAILSNILISLAAGVTTLCAALLSQVLASRRRRERGHYDEEVAKIADAVQTEEAARRVAILEHAAEHIATGSENARLTTIIEGIAAHLPLENSQATAAGAVEGLINNYHEQALSQAKTQFWFSIAAATIGFIWILFAGSAISPDNFATVFKILPGVVMDAAAFLFFRQASETRQRATELYDRLRRDKQVTEAASLLLSIEDTRLRSAVKAQVALHMAGLAPSPIDLSTFLSGDRGIYDRSELPQAVESGLSRKVTQPAAAAPVVPQPSTQFVEPDQGGRTGETQTINSHSPP